MTKAKTTTTKKATGDAKTATPSTALKGGVEAAIKKTKDGAVVGRWLAEYRPGILYEGGNNRSDGKSGGTKGAKQRKANKK